jgi:hypothetical protein
MSTDSKVIYFSDGESLASGDLNGIVDGATARAWEWPWYADMLAHAHMTGSYGSLFGVSPDSMGKMVFTRGGGGVVSATGANATVLQGGFLGVWSGANGPSNTLAPQMRWILANGLDTFNHVNAPVGQRRYDLITVSIGEGTTDSTSRHFKNAVTGAVTSATFPKRKTQSATFQVHAGTPSAGPALPAVPALPGGEWALALVLVDENGIAYDGDTVMYPASGLRSISNLTIPFGPCMVINQMPSRSSIHGVQWTESTYGELTANATPNQALFAAPFFGDPTARVVGVKLSYRLSAGSIVSMQRLRFQANFTDATFGLGDLSAGLTLDGAAHETMLDVRGDPLVAASIGPFWCNGRTDKENVLTSARQGLALAVASNSAVNNYIRGVTWVIAKG